MSRCVLVMAGWLLEFASNVIERDLLAITTIKQHAAELCGGAMVRAELDAFQLEGICGLIGEPRSARRTRRIGSTPSRFSRPSRSNHFREMVSLGFANASRANFSKLLREVAVVDDPLL